MKAKIWGMSLLAGLSIWLWGAPTAVGFQQTMTCTETGLYACEPGEAALPVHWNTRCATYKMNEDGSENFTGSSDELSNLEELRRAVRASFGAWNAVECSDMTLLDGGLTSSNDTGFDSDSENTNLVAWRDDGWGQVASSRAFALTSVTFNPKSGVIVDADIEVNTEFYDYSASPEPQPNHVDLRNTMTHEVGHFIGLDHTDERDATMFSTAPVGETEKRTLHPDDIRGICHTYPTSESSRAQCEGDIPDDVGDLRQSDGSTCSAVGDSAPVTPALALIALLGLRLARRDD